MLVAGGKVVDDSVQLLLGEVELQRVGGVGGRGDLGTRTVVCIIRTTTFKLKTVQKKQKNGNIALEQEAPANVAGVGDGDELAVADLDGGVLSVRHAQVEVEAEHRNT